MQPLINISRKQALLFACFLVLYEFLTYIANDMIMPGMLSVVKEFNAPVSDVASSLTAYVLGGASLQLFLGPVSDRYGRRPVMLFGVGFFLLFTALIPFVSSINYFLAARYFEGMGLCFINVVGYAVLQEIFAEKDAIRLVAILGNIAIMAPLTGPLLGAVFTHYFSWRFVFVVIASLSLVSFWGIWRYMPESVGAKRHDGTDIKRTELNLPTVFTNYKKLLTHSTFMMGALAFGASAVVCIVWIALSPVLLVNEAHLTLVQYGLWQIPIFAAFISGNMTLVHLSKRLSVQQLKTLGSRIVLAGLLMMGLVPCLLGDSYVWLMPGLIIYMFGYGIVMTPLNRFILFVTKVSKGTASAMISIVSMSTQALGIELAKHAYAFDVKGLGYYCAGVGVVFFLLANFVSKKVLSEVPDTAALVE